MADRIVITGVGAVTPLGQSLSETWAALIRGGNATRAWEDLAEEGFRATRACRIENLDAPPTRRGRGLALQAAAEAMAEAGLEGPFGAETGVYVGSTLGESAAFEAAAAGAEIDLTDHRIPSFCAALSEAHRISGPREAYATACAAGNYALAGATRALRHGRIARALAGGVEPFSRLSMVGFSRSRAMAAEACRPFDAQRSGMILGEGAAMFVLEREADALARGATPLAELRGFGLSCDAYHPTAPLPDGSGMRRSMQAALADAGLSPQEIGWVSIHGSGTRASDAAEGRALKDLFGGGVPPLAGFKGALGHGLGAASAIAAAIVVRAFRETTIPPTAGHDTFDPEIGIPCTREPRPMGARRTVLVNAFAFGGLNSAIVLTG